MTTELLEERLRPLPDGWAVGHLGRLRTVTVIGYGITRPGDHVDNGVGMIRAADVQDGQLNSHEPRRISFPTHAANARSELRAGDLVVVLVGRVGEAAVVTHAQHGWNASRTVAIVRTEDPGEAAWLRLWLGSPYVRDWCERRATSTTLQRTLSLAALRELPVPLPPTGRRAALVHTMRTVEAKSAVNTRIAECTVALSDARFAVAAQDHSAWPESPLSTLADLRSGSTPRPGPDQSSAEAGTAFVAPADILRSDLPYLYPTDRRLTSFGKAAVCPPYSLLVATREDGVRAVLSEMTVAPGRGVLTLRPRTLSDAYWLLHEIRSRSTELTSTAQGAGGRELSRRAFGATTLRWPPSEVRERFAQAAGRLRLRAGAARQENEILRGLRGRLLDSFLDGTFIAEPTQHPH
ncbi:hypothetical protein ACIQ7D_12050 [Streptomyces sp. NPDC096310]|uniref:hypothetical protein n=1 Tax=Streptomyces sp. NPDC096310 TaxID=3366082 RepID=UPI0038205B10